ncbi:MAG TPA: hypothetical protein VND94_00835 [Terriglobia bacterium]|nr:hypothetical protein [Terriglobia bacterium]
MSEQYPWLVVGAKITRAHDVPWKDTRIGERAPVFGEVYTVRSIEIWDGVIGITVAEIINPPRLMGEALFPASAFQPVRTISTDAGMSILRKIDADVFQQDEVLV